MFNNKRRCSTRDDSTDNSSNVPGDKLKHTGKRIKKNVDLAHDDNFEDLCKVMSRNKIKEHAIIYCRISTPNQVSGTSLSSQQMFCQQYCSKNKMGIKSIIHEIKSAKNMHTQLLLNEFLELNESINLIVYEPSRLSRNLKDFINFMDTCVKKNIIIHFVQNNLISSNTMDYKTIISGIIDGETESKNIGLRIKRSITYRKLQNTYRPSITQYGYKYVKTNLGNSTQTFNIEEQNIINLIQKLYWGSGIEPINELIVNITGIAHKLCFLTEPYEPAELVEYGNMKFIDIARFLNSIDINRRNKLWTSNSISKIINQ